MTASHTSEPEPEPSNSGLEQFLQEFALDEATEESFSQTQLNSVNSKAARLQAVFEKARNEYTPKIITDAWFSSQSEQQPHDWDHFQIPEPAVLQDQRSKEKTASNHQEWIVNYLYSMGRFELCLAYATSFCYSMGIHLNLDLDFPSPFSAAPTDLKKDPSLRQKTEADRRTRAERKHMTNWGSVKEIVDAAMRCISTLLRDPSSEQTASLSPNQILKTALTTNTIETWIPVALVSSSSQRCSADGRFGFASIHLKRLAIAYISFSIREVRQGAGDPRYLNSSMIDRDDLTGKATVVMDIVKVQNWTVNPGLTLTLGNLSLEMGFYRVAIESYTLFLASRGIHWRVLVALAHALCQYSDLIIPQQHNVIAGFDVLVQTCIVLALQGIPKRRRAQLASIILQGSIISKRLLNHVTLSSHHQSPGFSDEDDILFQSLLQPIETESGLQTVVLEQVAVALAKVVFAKKGNVLQLSSKFESYLQEYKQILQRIQSGETDASMIAHDLETVEDDDEIKGPRSVRTL